MSLFDDILDFVPIPGFPVRDVTDQKKFRRFLFSSTPKTPRISKMYNFMANWPRLEELLTFEPIADLRDDENEMKWNETRSSRELKRETCYRT